MKKIYIKKNNLGKGIYAKERIKKGDFIFKMSGEKITSKDFYKLNNKNRNALIDPLQIDDDLFINMDEPAVLINHSCKPNAGIKNQNLIAIIDIKKNEEIVYDYSSVWFEGIKCKCGSPKCRGLISDFLSLPQKTKNKYKNLNIVPKFITKKCQ